MHKLGSKHGDGTEPDFPSRGGPSTLQLLLMGVGTLEYVERKEIPTICFQMITFLEC